MIEKFVLVKSLFFILGNVEAKNLPGRLHLLWRLPLEQTDKVGQVQFICAPFNNHDNRSDLSVKQSSLRTFLEEAKCLLTKQ